MGDSAARWARGLDAVPVALVTVDVLDRTVVAANVALRALLGGGEPVGVRLVDLFEEGSAGGIDVALTLGSSVSWEAAALVCDGGRSTPVELLPGVPHAVDGQLVSVVAVREMASGLVDELVMRAHDVLGEGVLIGDGERLVYANEAACALYGRTLDELRGAGPLFALLVPDEQARITTLLEERAASGTAPPDRHETVIARPDGSTVEVEMSVKAAVRANHVRTITIVRDISDRRAVTRALAGLALEDALTGLANRRLLLDRIGQSVARSGRQGDKSDHLLFIDLDRFKSINDELGHAAGDEALKEVARRLRVVVRPSDTVARLGGDEFVVLAEGLDTTEEADAFAQRLRDAIGEPMAAAGQRLHLSASVGVQPIGQDPSADPAALLQRADAAMYRAKRER